MKKIDNPIKKELTKENLANFFNTYYDTTEKEYIYNLNNTIYIANTNTIAPRYYNNYIIEKKDTWTLISHKHYGNIELWWLICKINNIRNPFINIPIVGNTIKILTMDAVNTILDSI